MKLLKFIANFFQDRDGSSSATRLIFIIGSAWNMAICSILLVTLKSDITSVMTFFITVEGTLAALKLVQKQQEKKD